MWYIYILHLNIQNTYHTFQWKEPSNIFVSEYWRSQDESIVAVDVAIRRFSAARNFEPNLWDVTIELWLRAIRQGAVDDMGAVCRYGFGQKNFLDIFNIFQWSTLDWCFIHVWSKAISMTSMTHCTCFLCHTHQVNEPQPGPKWGGSSFSVDCLAGKSM